MTTMPEAERLVSAVGYLAQKSHTTLAVTQVRGAVSDALAGALDRSDALCGAARALGLSLTISELPFSGLLDEITAFPVLVWSETRRTYYALEEQRGDKLQIRALRLGGMAHTANAQELKALFGDASLQLIMPRLSRPLDALQGHLPHYSPWKRLAALIRMEARDLWVIATYAAAVGLLTLATPIAVQTLFNTVAFGNLRQPLVVLVLLLSAALGFSALLKVFETVVVELISRRIFVRAALDFTHRLPFVRRAALKTHPAELVNRFFDVVIVDKALSAIIFDGLSAALQIMVGLVLLGVYHPFLLAFDIFLVLAGLGVVALLGRRAVETALLESKSKYKVAEWLQDLAGVEFEFRSARGFEYAHGRSESLVSDWLIARKKHFRIWLRQFSGILILQVGASVLLLLIGGLLVIDRQLTLGQLVAAELVMTATVASLAKVGKLLGKVYDLLAALDKLGAVVDAPLCSVGGELLHDTDGALEVEVHGEWELHIQARERRAFIELNRPALLAGLIAARETDNGSCVRFNGLDAQDLDTMTLAGQICVIQLEEIFPGSLADNVGLGSLHASRPLIRDALVQAGLESLAVDLDLAIKRGGLPLSRDQRTLILIARAIANEPGLVVIDGALDDMSPRAQTLALNALLSEAHPWTVACVTRQPRVAAAFEAAAQASGAS